MKRFWDKVDKSGDCWEWTADKNSLGYGMLWFCATEDGVTRRWWKFAHRLAYEFEVGEIPSGMLVCHTCHDPSCVNPAHLYLGTNFTNMQDRLLADRNPEAKLTVEKVREVKTLLKEGKTQVAIAEIMGVHNAQISRIKTGTAWSAV